MSVLAPLSLSPLPSPVSLSLTPLWGSATGTQLVNGDAVGRPLDTMIGPVPPALAQAMNNVAAARTHARAARGGGGGRGKVAV